MSHNATLLIPPQLKGATPVPAEKEQASPHSTPSGEERSEFVSSPKSFYETWAQENKRKEEEAEKRRAQAASDTAQWGVLYTINLCLLEGDDDDFNASDCDRKHFDMLESFECQCVVFDRDFQVIDVIDPSIPRAEGFHAPDTEQHDVAAPSSTPSSSGPQSSIPPHLDIDTSTLLPSTLPGISLHINPHDHINFNTCTAPENPSKQKRVLRPLAFINPYLLPSATYCVAMVLTRVHSEMKRSVSSSLFGGMDEDAEDKIGFCLRAIPVQLDSTNQVGIPDFEALAANTSYAFSGVQGVRTVLPTTCWITTSSILILFTVNCLFTLITAGLDPVKVHS